MAKLTKIRVTAIIILLISLFALGIGCETFLHSSSTSFHEQIDAIKQDISKKDWQKANERITTLEESWYKNKSLWSMLTDHKKMESVESGLVTAKDYVKNKDSTPSIVALNLLIKKFDYIIAAEQLTLGNIL